MKLSNTDYKLSFKFQFCQLNYPDLTRSVFRLIVQIDGPFTQGFIDITGLFRAEINQRNNILKTKKKVHYAQFRFNLSFAVYKDINILVEFFSNRTHSINRDSTRLFVALSLQF